MVLSTLLMAFLGSAERTLILFLTWFGYGYRFWFGDRFSCSRSVCNVSLLLTFGIDRSLCSAVEPFLGPVMTFCS
ncbi:hypothetical protein EV361DRAFT_271483 [Lentinula raphanica]|nr:hypothetical protein EV361DRAFT_271483 [Lentinula raphanica]